MKKSIFSVICFFIIMLLSSCSLANFSLDKFTPYEDVDDQFDYIGNLRSSYFVPFLEGVVYNCEEMIYFVSKNEKKKIIEGTLLGQANDWIYYLNQNQVFAYNKYGNSVPCISANTTDVSFMGCFDGLILFFNNDQLYIINQDDHSIIYQIDLNEKNIAVPYLHKNVLYWIGGSGTAWDLLRTDLSDQSTQTLAQLNYVGTEKCSVVFWENCLYYFASYKLFCYDIAENAVHEFAFFKEGDNCAMWNGCAYVGIIGNKPKIQVYDLKTKKIIKTIQNAGGPESNEYGILWFENNSVTAHLKNGTVIREDLTPYETYYNVLPLKNGISIPAEEKIHIIKSYK